MTTAEGSQQNENTTGCRRRNSSVGTPTLAHRLDEYLQATTLSIERDRVQAQISLTPGVAVFPMVLAKIDTDTDGVISDAERQAYAERILRDLSLTVDGDRLRLRLVSSEFARTEEMKEGRGDIRLKFNADLPRSGPNRRLIFENHHLSPIAAYLVNCLVPRDPGIQVTAQKRNYEQSFYQLDYAQAGVRSSPRSLVWWSGAQGWLGPAALLLLAPLSLLWRRRTRAENNATPQQ